MRSKALRTLGAVFFVAGLVSVMDLLLRILSLSFKLPEDVFAFLALLGGYDLLRLMESARKPLLILLYSGLAFLALVAVLQPKRDEAFLRISAIGWSYELQGASVFWALLIGLAVIHIGLIVFLTQRRTKEVLRQSSRPSTDGASLD